MMWYFNGGMGWWMIFGVVITILFWGGLIAFAIWGVRRLMRHNSFDRRDPLDIAKERYARGEITKQQYEQIKKDLS
jgi:putative membrane protein